MPPPIAAFINEMKNKNKNKNQNQNQNEEKNQNIDMWQLGAMMTGVECEAEFGLFLIFIILYLFSIFHFLFSILCFYSLFCVFGFLRFYNTE